MTTGSSWFIFHSFNINTEHFIKWLLSFTLGPWGNEFIFPHMECYKQCHNDNKSTMMTRLWTVSSICSLSTFMFRNGFQSIFNSAIKDYKIERNERFLYFYVNEMITVLFKPFTRVLKPIKFYDLFSDDVWVEKKLYEWIHRLYGHRRMYHFKCSLFNEKVLTNIEPSFIYSDLFLRPILWMPD